MKIQIINYGIGNVQSLKTCLFRIGANPQIISEVPSSPEKALLILPGVGSFDSGVRRLRDSGWDTYIRTHSQNYGYPLLGICLGMQLLGTSSQEGSEQGLSLIPGHSIHFPTDNPHQYRVPHMKWNQVCPSSITATQFFSSSGQEKFYFVHSYYFKPDNPRHMLTTTSYGLTFTSSVRSDNVFGFQFHPERSHIHGQRLFSQLLSHLKDYA